jgi:hypothetical protein
MMENQMSNNLASLLNYSGPIIALVLVGIAEMQRRLGWASKSPYLYGGVALVAGFSVLTVYNALQILSLEAGVLMFFAIALAIGSYSKNQWTPNYQKIVVGTLLLLIVGSLFGDIGDRFRLRKIFYMVIYLVYIGAVFMLVKSWLKTKSVESRVW